MPHFVRCIEGHVFDAQLTPQCPICGATVEIAAASVEPIAQPGPAGPIPVSLAAFATRPPLLWAVGGIGLGLIVAAGVVWLRFAPATPSAAATASSAQTADTAQVEKADVKTADKDAASTEVASHGQGNSATASVPAQLDTASALPADTTDTAPRPAAIVAPTSSPGATSLSAPAGPSQQADQPSAPLPAAPADAAPSSAPTSAPAPAVAPTSSDDSSQQADLQSSSPSSGDVNPPPVATGPIDGEAFKAGIEDVLDKLGALAPIQSDIANIATGIAGLNLFDHGEEQAGLEMLQQAASDNVPFAAAALGQRYFNGTKTLKRDYEQARRWFDVASLADVPVANYELAVMYVRGFGVRRDPRLAGHYFLGAYHGGFASAVQIVTAARAGGRAERELLRRMGLDPVGMGMTVLQYYDARRASDPAGALAAIQQLASGLQWPAPHILAMAQWDGDGGSPDRAAAAKNFLIAARGGAFGALIPVAEASLDGTLGAPNPAQASLVASLVRLYSKEQSAGDLDKLNSVYKEALEKATPDQQSQLQRFNDLLGEVAPTGSEASVSAEPASGNP